MRRLCLLILILAAAPARAELPTIRLDRLFPLGVSAGGSVEVEVAGPDMEGARILVFDHPGVKAEFLKEHHFRVTVAADVPAGTYDARLVGTYGISNPRLFQVSHGLTEVRKKGGNHDPDHAQPVPVNAAVNGISDGNREDVYRFPLKRGQRVVIECHAGLLDSQLDATLNLTDADGKPLASNGHYNGRDPLVDFVAPGDGDYLVSVYDLSFRGGQPYRMVVSDRPQVENVFPRAIRAGEPTTVTVYGRNLGPQAKPSAWRVGDVPLDEYQETVTAPADLLAAGAYRFVEHPTTHSLFPTAATCTLTGFQFQPRPGGAPANPVPVLVTDTPVTAEVEPNDDANHAQPITLPAVVSGRFDKDRDADWYEFQTPADGPYSFEVYCERVAGRADPYLVVFDDKGTRLNEFDDFGHRMTAFDGHLRDASGVLNLPGKRTFRVMVQDRYRRGGARYQYVLAVRRASPDFYAAVIHHQNPGPAGLNVPRGGTAVLDVVIHQMEGFNGPITLTAGGLPAGLHAVPTTINGDTQGRFVIRADADAPDWTGPITLTATGKQGNLVRTRTVRPYTRVWAEPNIPSSRPTRGLVLRVGEQAPFALAPAADRVETKPGGKAEVKLHLDRRWPDFKGAVTVIPLDFPGQIGLGQVSIPEGKTEAVMTLTVNGGARPGEYTLAFVGQAQVPFSKDPKATAKPVTLVSAASLPFTLVVTPPGAPGR